ncbi:PD-(D/E)XK nuclease-like domain-containing protein [Limosilactobacillus mucosae]|uniref:PD-(D/E)XK nuclease-like domain-containing protein n=1 Tax=Limosilactobacillus mucosae TaxID=97478 RepID=UPI000FFBE8BA|nr:PD-(D/E)XK nuclease-like domain-containing protein [Limosilactobacillus mucosae]RXA58173.1 hypothetical protein EQ839_02995 [Limosilactobacillus mucosae]
MIELTKENYYDLNTLYDYMDKSTFLDFDKCELAALAKINGSWKPTSNPEALLVGNYVHSALESDEAHEAFIKENESSILSHSGTSKGKPKKAYKQADQMIQALKSDEWFKDHYAPGEKEVIVTGELFGHQWKGKIDSLDLDNGVFYDLKTTADFTKRWNEESRQREPFIYNGHYELQMAVYQQLIKQTFGKMCEPVIVGITKQTPPDMQAFDFESDGAKAAMANALEVVKNKQDHFWNVLMGEEAPKACGHCDYCRTKARLTDPVPFDMYDWPE